jgi:hypothetical protein
MATWIGCDHNDFHGAAAVAGGWLERARRLLEPLEGGNRALLEDAVDGFEAARAPSTS